MASALKELERTVTKPIKDARRRLREKYFPTHIKDRYAKVEFAAHCNARCDFCWMYYPTVLEYKPKGFMALENFKKFVSLNKSYFFRHKIRIQPYFNGECLMHPKVWDMFDVMVENKIGFMDLDSNLAVNKDLTPLMRYPFKHIRVNIGGITREVHESVMHCSWEHLTRNLRTILAIDPKRVIVKMNTTKKNRHMIPGLQTWFKEMGGIPEQISPDGMSFPLPALATKEEKKFFFENIVEGDEEGMSKHLYFDYDKTGDDYTIRSRYRECGYLITAVAYDGRVSMCCHDQTGLVNLGNAFEQPIIEIVLSRKYQQANDMAKRMAFSFCDNCN